jgi:hypothetical protein
VRLTALPHNFTLYSVTASPSQNGNGVQPPPPSRPALCSCERPAPRERADYKGGARTFCERCGLPMPLTWR